MKIVLFGEESRVGAVEDDRIVDLNEAYLLRARDRNEETHDERGRCVVPEDLRAFIEGGESVLAASQRALHFASTLDLDERGMSGRRIVLSASGTELHAPWPGNRIACAGGNYADHLARFVAKMSGAPIATFTDAARRARETGQWGFWKLPSEVAGPNDDIPVPRRAERFDYEAEVAIIVADRVKDVAACDAPNLVWGVTLLNDWSIRAPIGDPRPLSYNLAKNFDGCVSMGPAILVGHVPEAGIDIELRVNGELRQRFNCRSMIFSFSEILEELSRDLTLVPGDVISGGTGAGTAADSASPTTDTLLYLRPGDVVEVSSPQIGLLKNRIVEARIR